MPDARRKGELGRGERVLPGVWRLRLPLPFTGVPHCNAWALAAGDGIVLVDCGLHEPGSLGHLERALDQVNLHLELVRLLVCTHAHVDHYGQAATVVERSGCELWMHPAHGHLTAGLSDPETALAQRVEIARASGLPDRALRAIERDARSLDAGVAGLVQPDRDLVEGVEVSTDLGSWRAIETPGHAPSHVVLWQPERRLLLSGDHLLGRVSLYFDHGHTPDPVGEFLRSLDVVEHLGVRLCLPGHGRSFGEVPAHVAANRALVAERLGRVVGALRERALTPFEVVPHVYDDATVDDGVAWRLVETLGYLRHLEATAEVRCLGRDEGAERWMATETSRVLP